MLLTFPVLAILSLSIGYFLLSKHKKDAPFHPPPGPKGFPIIGNLHQFDASKPHVYFTKLANLYGPIISLRIGRVRMVVVQSAKLAKEVLQTQDLNFCHRPLFYGMRRLSYNGLDVVFAPYNEYFRELKKLSVVHLFSSKRVESFAPIYQEEVLRLIKRISSLADASEIVNLSDLLIGFSSSTTCRIAFGKRYKDGEGRSRSRFHSTLNEAQALFIAFFFANYFPFSEWLDKLTGNVARVEKTFRDLDALFEEIINDHLDQNNRPKGEREDIVDVLLHLMNDRSFGLTIDHIKALLLDMLLAGTDTSAATVVWAMTELLRNPTVMKKAQEEVRNAVGNKDYVEKIDHLKLKYLKSVVKETFRLHPVAPLLVPHKTIKRCTLDGYDIQPETVVYVNVWAIGRDPQSWINPKKFMPERFLECSIDFKGHDFELIPFGAGRRICPGINLGVTIVEHVLANLLYCFDWELPAGLTKEDIDTNVVPGITMHKEIPLCLVAKKFVCA